jgi:Na+/H+ antiporter NhaD/arsenite permease-like protein
LPLLDAPTIALLIFVVTYILLAAGTGLGGNGAIIGASSSVTAVGLAQAKEVKVTFVEFAKIRMVLLVLTTLAANLILILKLLV